MSVPPLVSWSLFGWFIWHSKFATLNWGREEGKDFSPALSPFFLPLHGCVVRRDCTVRLTGHLARTGFSGSKWPVNRLPSSRPIRPEYRKKFVSEETLQYCKWIWSSKKYALVHWSPPNRVMQCYTLVGSGQLSNEPSEISWNSLKLAKIQIFYDHGLTTSWIYKPAWFL